MRRLPQLLVGLVLFGTGLWLGLMAELGVLLGGPVGVGTVLFALGIGPAVQWAFRLLRQTPLSRPVEAPA